MSYDRDTSRREWWRRQKNHPQFKPSNYRRMAGHDYRSRCIYMITLVTKDRKPVLGTLRDSDDIHTKPWVELSPLGKAVLQNWRRVPTFRKEMRMIQAIIMPDHMHGILFVTEPMPCHLGNVINGFKKACNDASREADGDVLWQTGYHDRILRGENQLNNMLRYIVDNPRRKWIRNHHPEFFTVHHDITIAGRKMAMAGNTFLLQYPLKEAVRCSRNMSNEDIEKEIVKYLTKAEQGIVPISPCISNGEKKVMRAIFDAGFPHIVVMANGFSPNWKPGGAQFDACARGQLLLISPWEYQAHPPTIKRVQCLELNEIAQMIANDTNS